MNLNSFKESKSHPKFANLTKKPQLILVYVLPFPNEKENKPSVISVGKCQNLTKTVPDIGDNGLLRRSEQCCNMAFLINLADIIP